MSLAVAGCASSARYSARTAWPHKDVLVISIELQDTIAPAEYQEIARREARKHLRASAPGELPVYEVRCEFYRRAPGRPLPERVAQVRLFPQDAEHAGPGIAFARTWTEVY